MFDSSLGLAVFCLLKYILCLNFLDGSIDMWQIAAVHTVFNIMTFAVVYPFSFVLERIALKFIKDHENVNLAKGK